MLWLRLFLSVLAFAWVVWACRRAERSIQRRPLGAERSASPVWADVEAEPTLRIVRLAPSGHRE